MLALRQRIRSSTFFELFYYGTHMPTPSSSNHPPLLLNSYDILTSSGKRRAAKLPNNRSNGPLNLNLVFCKGRCINQGHRASFIPIASFACCCQYCSPNESSFIFSSPISGFHYFTTYIVVTRLIDVLILATAAPALYDGYTGYMPYTTCI